MSVTEPRIETSRLILRLPRIEDFDGYAELHADEEAARHIGGAMPRAAAWRKFLQHPGAWMVQGYAMFSVIDKTSGEWLGQCGPWQPEGWPGTEEAGRSGGPRGARALRMKRRSLRSIGHSAISDGPRLSTRSMPTIGRRRRSHGGWVRAFCANPVCRRRTKRSLSTSGANRAKNGLRAGAPWRDRRASPIGALHMLDAVRGACSARANGSAAGHPASGRIRRQLRIRATAWRSCGLPLVDADKIRRLALDPHPLEGDLDPQEFGNVIGTVSGGTELWAEGPLKDADVPTGTGYAVAVQDADGHACRGYVAMNVVDRVWP